MADCASSDRWNPLALQRRKANICLALREESLPGSPISRRIPLLPSGTGSRGIMSCGFCCTTEHNGCDNFASYLLWFWNETYFKFEWPPTCGVKTNFKTIAKLLQYCVKNLEHRISTDLCVRSCRAITKPLQEEVQPCQDNCITNAKLSKFHCKLMFRSW